MGVGQGLDELADGGAEDDVHVDGVVEGVGEVVASEDDDGFDGDIGADLGGDLLDFVGAGFHIVEDITGSFVVDGDVAVFVYEVARVVFGVDEVPEVVGEDKFIGLAGAFDVEPVVFEEDPVLVGIGLEVIGKEFFAFVAFGQVVEFGVEFWGVDHVAAVEGFEVEEVFVFLHLGGAPFGG